MLKTIIASLQPIIRHRKRLNSRIKCMGGLTQTTRILQRRIKRSKRIREVARKIMILVERMAPITAKEALMRTTCKQKKLSWTCIIMWFKILSHKNQKWARSSFSNRLRCFDSSSLNRWCLNKSQSSLQYNNSISSNNLDQVARKESSTSQNKACEK